MAERLLLELAGSIGHRTYSLHEVRVCLLNFGSRISGPLMKSRF